MYKFVLDGTVARLVHEPELLVALWTVKVVAFKELGIKTKSTLIFAPEPITVIDKIEGTFGGITKDMECIISISS